MSQGLREPRGEQLSLPKEDEETTQKGSSWAWTMNRSLKYRLLCSHHSIVPFTSNYSLHSAPTPSLSLVLHSPYLLSPSVRLSLLIAFNYQFSGDDDDDDDAISTSPMVFPSALDTSTYKMLHHPGLNSPRTDLTLLPWSSSWVNMSSSITEAHKDHSLSQNLSSSYTCTVETFTVPSAAVSLAHSTPLQLNWKFL